MYILGDIIIQKLKERLTVRIRKKKEKGEVFTPPELIEYLLNNLPNHLFRNPDLKWIDPSSGIGHIVIMIYCKLMDGLQENISCPKKRSKHIIENMLYMVELDEENASQCVALFKIIDSKSKPNIKILDFFNFNKSIFGIDKFDVIVGNPPYQTLIEGNTKTKQIWHNFILNSLNILQTDGYLSYIIPNSWRNYCEGNYPCGKIFNKFQNLQLDKLTMLSYKKSRGYFPQVSISLDIVYIKNTESNDNITHIIDQDENVIDMNLNKWKFIPSGSFTDFQNIITNVGDRVKILYSPGMYESRYDHISKVKDETFKYPVCYSITQKNKLKCLYSNIKKDMFGVPKVIWSNGVGTYPIKDPNGEYGLTQFCYGIEDKVENLDKIIKCMNSDKFIKLMKYVKYTNNKYNYKIISLFKKDFYKYFIDES